MELKKKLVNVKTRASCQPNMFPKHYFKCRNKQQKMNFKKRLGR